MLQKFIMNAPSRTCVFPAKLFYSGSTKKEYLFQLRRRRLRKEREKNYIQRPLPNTEQYTSCFSEKLTWKWFPTQQLAIEHITGSNDKNLFLFAYEKSAGKRKFLVTTHQQFWSKYVTMEDQYLHFYEVLRSNDPCRLYFDIEFKKVLNSQLNGVDVLYMFIDVICYCLFKRFSVACSANNVVDLDSSTATKYSRHLIFHFPDASMFKNNINCGYFVKEVCALLKLFVETRCENRYFPMRWDSDNQISGFGDKVVYAPEQLQQILVEDENGSTFLCDLSVYSKNRNFRLYMSSKVSKHVPLRISTENKFKFKSKLSSIEAEIYQVENRVFNADYQKFLDTLICPFEDIKPCTKLLSFEGINITTGRSGDYDSAKVEDLPSHCEYSEGSFSTCYPLLDTFVLNIVKKTGSNGIIRRWMSYKKSGLMIYDIGNNRWCGNIQRQHKSNHVYYIADLTHKILYQKCHDPDCINYRSPEIIIPDDINPIADNCLERIEDFDVSADEELNEIFAEDIHVCHGNCQDCKKNSDCNSNNSVHICCNEDDFDELLDDNIDILGESSTCSYDVTLAVNHLTNVCSGASAANSTNNKNDDRTSVQNSSFKNAYIPDTSKLQTVPVINSDTSISILVDGDLHNGECNGIDHSNVSDGLLKTKKCSDSAHDPVININDEEWNDSNDNVQNQNNVESVGSEKSAYSNDPASAVCDNAESEESNDSDDSVSIVYDSTLCETNLNGSMDLFSCSSEILSKENMAASRNSACESRMPCRKESMGNVKALDRKILGELAGRDSIDSYYMFCNSD